MKKNVTRLVGMIIIITVVIMAGCWQNSQNQVVSDTTGTEKISDATTDLESGDDNYTDILNKWLKLDLSQSVIIDSLGQPEEKSVDTYWGATGMYVQTWKYPSKGISLDMESEKENGSKVVLSITIAAPCRMVTSELIGIGSDKDLIFKEYTSDVNAEHSDNESIVVGSIYGGVIFSIKNNKVNGIFIGAAAE